MKKVMSKILLSLTFALAFVFAGALTVEAAGYTPKNNVKVTAGEQGKVYQTVVEGSSDSKEILYAVESKDALLKLKYIKNNEGSYAFTSNITIVKCMGMSNTACNSWMGYSPSVNVDQLRSGGFTVSLDVFKVDASGHAMHSPVSGTINGTDLSTLNSAYGMDNVIYILIDYVAVKEYWHIFKGTQQEIVAAYSEVVKVLPLQEINGYVTISSEFNGNKIDATVTASLKLKEIKYFETTETYDFATLASTGAGSVSEAFDKVASDNGYTIETVNVTNTYIPKAKLPREGIAYETNFSVDKEDGKHYYVCAEDVFGNMAVYDISVQGGTNGNVGGSSPLAPNAADTNVGKIILVVLVGVLVLAAVLVIIQKIVDHKRKLY